MLDIDFFEWGLLLLVSISISATPTITCIYFISTWLSTETSIQPFIHSRVHLYFPSLLGLSR